MPVKRPFRQQWRKGPLFIADNALANRETIHIIFFINQSP